MCIFGCLKHAELSLPYVGEKVLMGSWLSGVVGRSSQSGRTSRLPFMVRLHNDPNPKARQNVKVKNMKSCRMNQKAQKNTQTKKEIFLRMVNNFRKNDSILIWFSTSSKIHSIKSFNSAVL